MAGIAAGVVLIALLASGFDFERSATTSSASSTSAANAASSGVRSAFDGAARGDRPLGFAAPPAPTLPEPP